MYHFLTIKPERNWNHMFKAIEFYLYNWWMGWIHIEWLWFIWKPSVKILFLSSINLKQEHISTIELKVRMNSSFWQETCIHYPWPANISNYNYNYLFYRCTKKPSDFALQQSVNGSTIQPPGWTTYLHLDISRTLEFYRDRQFHRFASGTNHLVTQGWIGSLPSSCISSFFKNPCAFLVEGNWCRANK